MIARLYWPDTAPFTPQQDAFWVEFSAGEARVLFPQPPTIWHRPLQAGQDVYALVSRDGQVTPHEWFFPFSGQWNAYNPFLLIRPVIVLALAHLAAVAPEQVPDDEQGWLPLELTH